MEIRTAKPDDAEAISDLLCELATTFITSEFSNAGRQALLETMSVDFIDRCMRSDFSYWVAETGDQLAGVIGVKGNRHLYHLFVAENFQRRGIARKLWQKAMTECLANGNPGEFTVNSSLNAQAVYEKLGFVALCGPTSKNGVVFVPMKLKFNNQADPGL